MGMVSNLVLFLKATVKKRLFIPGYTRKDGTFVKPHHQSVNMNPQAGMTDVLDGKGSYSQKLAHKKLHAEVDGFGDLAPVDQYHHIASAATKIQTAATISAGISKWKSVAFSGKNPTVSQWAAFNTLSPDEKLPILDDVANHAGGIDHLIDLGEKKQKPKVSSNAFEFITKYSGSLKDAATEWLAEFPTQPDTLSSALVDAGHLSIAKQLGIYNPPGEPKDGDQKSGVNGTTLVFHDGHWHTVQDGFSLKDGSAVYMDGSVWLVDGQSDIVLHLRLAGHPVGGMGSAKNVTKQKFNKLIDSGDAYTRVDVGFISGVDGWMASLAAGKVPTVDQHAAVVEHGFSDLFDKAVSRYGEKVNALIEKSTNKWFETSKKDPPQKDESSDPWSNEQWSKLFLDESNTNAKAHKHKIDQMRSFAKDGDIDSIQSMHFGSNTYGKKQAKIATALVAAMGTDVSEVNEQKEAVMSLLSGDGSHYKVKAAKKLSSDVGVWGEMDSGEKLAAISKLAGEMQSAASASAAVSGYKKHISLGKVPTKSQALAFAQLPAVKQTEIVQKMVSLYGLNFVMKYHNAAVSKYGGDDITTFDSKKQIPPSPVQDGVSLPGDTQWAVKEKIPAAVKKLMQILPSDVTHWLDAIDSNEPPTLESAKFIDHATKKNAAKFYKYVKLYNNTDVGWMKDIYRNAAASAIYGFPDSILMGDGSWKPFSDVSFKKDAIGMVQSVQLISSVAIDSKLGKKNSLEKFSENEHGDSDQDSPKDGDTKPAVGGGLLVFKDGRWHKDWPDGFFVKNVSGAYSVEIPDKVKDNPQEYSALVAVAKKHGGFKLFSGNIGFSEGSEGRALAFVKEANAGIQFPVSVAPASTEKPAVMLQDTSPGHNKFWSVTVHGETLVKHYGVIGKKGVTKSVKCVSPLVAEQSAKKQVAAKIKNGYKLTEGSVSKLQVPPSDTTSQPKPKKKAAKITHGSPSFSNTDGGATVTSMDGWAQTGDQKGSNTGGRFRDSFGNEWYCKFPKDSSVCHNEYLATKFYQMLGVSVPDVKLVEKGGKLGIASKWMPGISTADSSALAKTPGVRSGFAIDAWLANWDVVGLSNDNLMVSGGAAVRVDSGGALLYRAMGTKKGAAFTDDVPEFDTLVDASVNSQSAAVFSGITKKEMMWGVKQLNKLKPSQIEELCSKASDGSAASKTALAKKLIARRSFILDKFGVRDQWDIPKLDESNLNVHGADLPKPLDFSTMNDGKGLSSKDWVNKQNSKDSAVMINFASHGNLSALKSYKYDAVNKETGKPAGKRPIIDHPSKHIKEQWVGLVELLQSIATPPVESLDMPSLGSASTVEEVGSLLGYFSPDENVSSIPAEHRMHFFMKLGQIDNPEILSLGHNWHHLSSTQKWVKHVTSTFSHFSSTFRGYVDSVQANGVINHIFSLGKSSANVNGKNIGKQKLASIIYKEAVSLPEDITITRFLSDTSPGNSMSKQFLKANAGLVVQNTDSMCASYKKDWSWGGDVKMVIHCPKGSKAIPSFGSGAFKSEHEITTLPGQRFVILNTKEHGSSGVEVECIMLPPDSGYIAGLDKLASLGKAMVVFVKRSQHGYTA